MRDLYKENEYCMEFSEEEIVEYIIKPSQIYSDINIQYEKSEGTFTFVSFDGLKESFYIRFYGHLTAIFILNEEFMFFDDKAKEHQTSSETYENIVYEGFLRDKTHKEILKIIFEVFKILLGAKKIRKKETEVSQKGWYTQYNYEINIYNDFQIKNEVQFENILFRVNMK